MPQYKERTFTCIGCSKSVTKRTPAKATRYCSLECYRSSQRPARKTGTVVRCAMCGAEVYKQKVHLKHASSFCSIKCSNEYQGRNKIQFICRICGDKFRWSKSRTTQANPTYCSMVCRNKDTQRLSENSYKGNMVQWTKKGPNKLELEGRKILRSQGLRFNEQVLMYDKFLVDVVVKGLPLIIQWDGEYWHTKPKRMALDRSQDAYLKKCGYTVLRFSDKQVYKDVNYVISNIESTVRQLTATSPGSL